MPLKMAPSYKKVKVMYTRWQRVHRTDQKSYDNIFTESCESDVKSLKAVFSGVYHFSATDYMIKGKRSTSGTESEPKASHVCDFISSLTASMNRDDLFVFYYVGHGGRNERGDLFLSGGKHHIEYEEIRKKLEQLSCDVLVIMDCCKATNATQHVPFKQRVPPHGASANSVHKKKFNFLGACMAYNNTTGDPQSTMTTRLAKALRGLPSGASYTVFQITGEMDVETRRIKAANGRYVWYTPLEVTGGDIVLTPILKADTRQSLKD